MMFTLSHSWENKFYRLSMIKPFLSYKSTALIFLTLCCHIMLAQPSTPHAIRILSHVKSDHVWLRWAPTDFMVWQLGNKYGYAIERFQLKTDGTLQSPIPAILHGGIKPLPKEELSKLATTNDDAAIIEELIYSEEDLIQQNGPASILQKQNDLNNRFGIALLACDLSPGIARAAGLFFSDSTAQTGVRYIYKIALAISPQKIEVTPGVIVVDVNPAKPLQPFNDLAATFGDKTVTLSWPLMLHQGVYSAYLIERYDEKEKQFKSITGLPYIPMSESTSAEQAHFVDSLANNTLSYQYRVKGITPFGETGPPSNSVAGTGKDDLSGTVVITHAKPEKNKVVIRWEFPASFEKRIGGFIIGKSEKAEGPYRSVTSKALNPKAREFPDAFSVASNYYQVRAVDTHGNELSHSYPYFVHVEDNNPPAVPVGLSGSIDSTGLVILTWKENTDRDLLGYRLFSAHNAHHEFVEITQEITTGNTFTDTIRIDVLNKGIFYKVIAVDRNYNTSEYSNHLKLTRPDIISPVPPVISKTALDKAGVSLSWVNSSSSDVAKSVLVRTAMTDSSQIKLLTWSAREAKTSYVDNTISLGERYRYTIRTYDSAGNSSTATSRAIIAESGIRKAVTELTATIDRENKTITLRWKYDEPAAKINIYRRKNNEPFSLYQSLPEATQEFPDNHVVINNAYSYKIQLVLNNRVKTELSKELKVPY
jgi:fibronectin type 3 domain-containing protein